MSQNRNQKKLVEAFKTFFEKTINPHVCSNQTVMNEWKYFQRLISSDPVDIHQIQFYLLLANKSNSSLQSQQNPTDYRHSALNEMNHIKYTQTLPSSQRKIQINPNKSLEKREVNQKQMISPLRKGGENKKNLLHKLSSFQSLLLKNQERLESFNSKEGSKSGNRRYL